MAWKDTESFNGYAILLGDTLEKLIQAPTWQFETIISLSGFKLKVYRVSKTEKSALTEGSPRFYEILSAHRATI